MTEKTFLFHRKIRMQDTDCTGVAYFTSVLHFATEAFEEFAFQQKWFTKFLFPIRKVGVQYFAPLRWTESVDIHLKIIHMDTSHLEIEYKIYSGEILTNKISVVHAIRNKKGERVENFVCP